jgi:hypothetical protein
VNPERSPAAKMRELIAVLAMFGIMIFVVRRSFVVDERPPLVPTAVVTPTVAPTPSLAGSVKLLEAPPELSAEDSATFSYQWTGAQSGTFECRLDEQDFAPCDPSGELLVDLADGIHTFQVRVVRAEGGPTTAESHSWTVDATAPSLAMSPEGGEFVKAPLVTLESSEQTDIYYTTDGTEPSAESAVYRAPIPIEAPLTVKAIAMDQAGNTSEVATGSFGFTTAFRDGFESESLAEWSTVDGLQIETGTARSGTASARAVSTDGARSFAGLEFGVPVADLYVQTAFRVESQGDNPLSLVRLRTDANASILNLYVTSSGRLAIQLAGTTSVTSSTVVVPGAWHEVQAHVVVAGGESRVEVWFDGQFVRRLNVTADLGVDPIRTMQLGESAEGRMFDVRFDDVATDDVFIPSSFLILIGGPAASPVAPATPVTVASPESGTPAAGASPAATPGATPEP